MKQIIFFATLTLLLVAGCEKKEEKKENLEFTEGSEAFTADRNEEKINAIKLTDITEASGIEFIHINGAFGKKGMPETVGSGGGFLDYNNDGWPDIFLVNSSFWPGHELGKDRPRAALFENNKDGTFTNTDRRVQRCRAAVAPVGISQ